MSAPGIDVLPPAPEETDSVEDFEAKGLEFAAGLAPFRAQVVALAAWMGVTAEEVDAAKASAEGAAATAASAAAAASAAVMAGVYGARDEAEDARDAAQAQASSASGAASLALGYKTSAEAAAAAAGSAAGLPALTGHAGKPLRVRRDGTGVAFDFGPIGALKTTPVEPGLPIVAVSGDLVDCRAAGLIIALPTSPEDLCAVVVRPNGFNPTVDPGAASIEGVSDTVVIDLPRPCVFVYFADLDDWGVF